MSTIVATYLSRKPHKRALALNTLVIAAIGVVTVICWRSESLRNLWIANRDVAINQMQIHRLILSMFVHRDPAHFLSNAYMFAILGFLVCGYFGVRLYFFMLFVLGSLVHLFSLMTYDLHTNLIGVSGVVYLFAGFWLVMYVGIDRRFSLGSRMIRAIGVGLVILFPSTIEPNISYRAHGIGLCLGVLMGLIYFRMNKEYFRKFEIVRPEEPDESFDPRPQSPTWH